MKLRRIVLPLMLLAALLASSATPAGAQFTENALGRVTASGSVVTIHTGSINGPRWFGLRVFTAAPGTMQKHNVLKTSTKGPWYDADAASGGKVLCVSNFQGTGSPTGGMFGPASALGAAADPMISMVGGFAGKKTGCADGAKSKNIKITMSTSGAISQAFYGAFYGDSPADWRGPAGDISGNPAWWNLWGNFTALGFGSTG